MSKTFVTQAEKDAAIVVAKKLVADTADHAEKAKTVEALQETEDAVVTG